LKGEEELTSDQLCTTFLVTPISRISAHQIKAKMLLSCKKDSKYVFQLKLQIRLTNNCCPDNLFKKTNTKNSYTVFLILYFGGFETLIFLRRKMMSQHQNKQGVSSPLLLLHLRPTLKWTILFFCFLLFMFLSSVLLRHIWCLTSSTSSTFFFHLKNLLKYV